MQALDVYSRDWTASEPSITSLAPARTAFERALALLKTKHPNSRLLAELSATQDLQDVMRTIETAKAHYEKKSGSKARQWLGQFATSVSNFVPVFDAVVPQTSEYVSAAWGTIRILLVVCLVERNAEVMQC